MIDSDFLDWVANRMVGIYGENEDIDFIHKLRRMAKSEAYKNNET